ncbi:hypothetical protein, partial [Deinococcus wulumuqiensis]|uniref:hypothetical protein n=1 Tax=Deinococcus wulumuqiensis TaxID=980427 RepID=UPI001CEF70CF
RRLCIHIAESVFFPTPFSRIESRNLLDSIGIRISALSGMGPGSAQERFAGRAEKQRHGGDCVAFISS